jgi:hypothetical protein
VPAAGCEVAEEALRTASLLGKARRAVNNEVCDWGTLLGRVHVEKEAVAETRGARMAGGWRLANALAGHRALRASIVAVCSAWSGIGEERWAAVDFVAMSQLRAFGLGELLWSPSGSLHTCAPQILAPML